MTQAMQGHLFLFPPHFSSKNVFWKYVTCDRAGQESFCQDTQTGWEHGLSCSADGKAALLSAGMS